MPDQTELTDQSFSESVATFGDRLTAARIASGMSVETLATNLGVDVSKVNDWENNRDEPRANRIQMIAGMLNISVVWLISGESNGTTNVEDGHQRPESVNEALGVAAEVKAALLAALDRIESLERRLK